MFFGFPRVLHLIGGPHNPELLSKAWQPPKEDLPQSWPGQRQDQDLELRRCTAQAARGQATCQLIEVEGSRLCRASSPASWRALTLDTHTHHTHTPHTDIIHVLCLGECVLCVWSLDICFTCAPADAQLLGGNNWGRTKAETVRAAFPAVNQELEPNTSTPIGVMHAYVREIECTWNLWKTSGASPSLTHYVQHELKANQAEPDQGQPASEGWLD